MVAAIKQQVTVQPGGVIEIRSPELTPGASAEVIVLLAGAPAAGLPPAAADRPGLPGQWRRHAGALRGGDPGSADNDKIDADLAREYGSPPEPTA